MKIESSRQPVFCTQCKYPTAGRLFVGINSFSFHCDQCNSSYYFSGENISFGRSIIEPSLAPQQEPAVQVPATAPAAGHLSKNTDDQ